MEVQTTTSIGKEVSELMELLLDAQIRLKQSVDVSIANGSRRTLLEKEEVEVQTDKNAKSDRVTGIMDIFG